MAEAVIFCSQMTPYAKFIFKENYFKKQKKIQTTTKKLKATILYFLDTMDRDNCDIAVGHHISFF